MRTNPLAFGVPLAILLVAAAAPGAENGAGGAVRASGVQAGFCVHLGVTDGKLTAELGASGKFLVHGLAADDAALAAARKHIEARALGGRVAVERGALAPLPYADGTVNLLVVSGAGALMEGKLRLAEVLRALAPGGAACLEGWKPPDGKAVTVRATAGDWTILTKPYPAGGDEWTHFNYDTSSNRVSRDVLVEPFFRLRWIAGVEWPMPDYHAKSMVVGGGRVYYVINESPRDKSSWPCLSVRDAFSGVLLWKRSPAPKALTMIADGPRFYMESGSRMVAVDGASGELIKTYEEAASPQWAYLAGGALLISCGKSGAVKCLDAETGALRWSFDKRSLLPQSGLNNAAVRGNELLYVEADRRTIGSVDLATGAEKWNRDIGKDLGAPGKVALNACAEGVMVLSSEGGIHGFSAKDGSHLWDHVYERLGTPTRRKAKSYRDGFFIDGLYWAHVGDLDPKQDEKYKYLRGRIFYWQGLDPLTGKEVRRLPYPEGKEVGASCFPDQASARWFMGGYSDFVEIKTGKYHPKATALKTSCGIGPRVAYGLMYNTTLYMPGRFLQGDMALEGAGKDEARPPDAPGRLEKGPAYGRASGPAAGPEDWPVHRGNPARTSRGATKVPAALVELWSADVGQLPTAPTVAAGKVFAASAESHRVMAFDAAEGKPLWSFTAGSRVRVPPSYVAGQCLFGAADGKAYCLDAASGELAWSFEAARTPRRIVARERAESPWPVDEGVLVHDGLAYFAAGRHGGMDGGIDFYALECAGGKVVWHKTSTDSPCARMLACDGKAISTADRGVRFGLKSIDGKVPASGVPEGAHDRDVLLPTYLLGRTATLTAKLRGLVSAGGLIFAAGRPDPEVAEAPAVLWQRPRKNESFANVPDVHPLDRSKPEANDWRLWTFSADDGRKIGELRLPAEPAWDSLAAAGGRIYLTTVDGRLRCFGGK